MKKISLISYSKNVISKEQAPENSKVEHVKHYELIVDQSYQRYDVPDNESCVSPSDEIFW